MNRPGSSIFSLSIIILSALFLAACGGSTAEEPAASSEIASTKTSMPMPEEGSDAESNQGSEEAYPPPAPEPAPAQENYPADNSGSGTAGGMRTFVIVPEESSASYLADEEFFEDALAKLGINAGKADVVGTTENVQGQIQFDLQDLAAPLGETTITADLGALKTDQGNRDRWLQENGGGPQFASSPLASFTATGINGLPAAYSEGEEVQFELSGDMTVRETTIPVVFAVTAVVSGNTLTGTAETRLLMSDFGIQPPNFARTLSVADEFGIRVNLVARESQ